MANDDYTNPHGRLIGNGAPFWPVETHTNTGATLSAYGLSVLLPATTALTVWKLPAPPAAGIMKQVSFNHGSTNLSLCSIQTASTDVGLSPNASLTTYAVSLTVSGPSVFTFMSRSTAVWEITGYYNAKLLSALTT